MLKFAYFGSPDFAGRFLEKIIKDDELKKHLDLKFVVTQKDKPSGRKRIMTPTPVKFIAQKYSVAVFDYELESRVSKTGVNYGILVPEKIDQKMVEDLDLVLVYAYGAIISKKIMTLPRLGFWNIHPSLLPRYRGTAPMATPLINGDKNTGVTIIKMDNRMDHGPIIAQTMYTIQKSDKRPDLETKLTSMGFELFKSVILKSFQDLVDRPQNKFGMTLREQDHSKASYTEKLKKDDGFINFDELKNRLIDDPAKLYNLYRGLYTWPGIWTILPNGKRLKIVELEYERGLLHIKRVQLEGKKETSFKVFNDFHKMF